MKTVEVQSDNVEPPHWLPDLEAIASRVYGELGRVEWEVAVLLCDDDRISELNTSYRKIEGPTDVLTFSHDEDGDGIAGDVAISLPTVEANAAGYGVPITEEFLRVYVHALLHLAGFTHEGVDLSSAEAADHPMLGLQERLVTAIHKEHVS